MEPGLDMDSTRTFNVMDLGIGNRILGLLWVYRPSVILISLLIICHIDLLTLLITSLIIA